MKAKDSTIKMSQSQWAEIQTAVANLKKKVAQFGEMPSPLGPKPGDAHPMGHGGQNIRKTMQGCTLTLAGSLLSIDGAGHGIALHLTPEQQKQLAAEMP